VLPRGIPVATGNRSPAIAIRGLGRFILDAARLDRLAMPPHAVVADEHHGDHSRQHSCRLIHDCPAGDNHRGDTACLANQPQKVGVPACPDLGVRERNIVRGWSAGRAFADGGRSEAEPGGPSFKSPSSRRRW
jgi:hypothetical protein